MNGTCRPAVVRGERPSRPEPMLAADATPVLQHLQVRRGWT